MKINPIREVFFLLYRKDMLYISFSKKERYKAHDRYPISVRTPSNMSDGFQSERLSHRKLSCTMADNALFQWFTHAASVDGVRPAFALRSHPNPYPAPFGAVVFHIAQAIFTEAGQHLTINLESDDCRIKERQLGCGVPRFSNLKTYFRQKNEISRPICSRTQAGKSPRKKNSSE